MWSLTLVVNHNYTRIIIRFHMNSLPDRSNHTYHHHPPFNKRLSTSTPTKCAPHATNGDLQNKKHLRFTDTQANTEGTVEHLSQMLASRIDSAQRATQLSQDILHQ